LTLTTVADGTTITAAAVQNYISAIETYLNEGIATADVSSAPWVESYHVFKPEFIGSPDKRAEMVSGDLHYRLQGGSLYTGAAFHHDLIKNGVAYVPGLQVTFKVTGGTWVRVLCSFAAFEWGGIGTVDEGPAVASVAGRAGTFKLHLDGAVIGGTTTSRNLYESGMADPAVPAQEESCVVGALVARKQFSIAEYVYVSGTGVHTIGVQLAIPAPVKTGASWDQRHVFVLQRSIVVDYFQL
jgi:hypothetical protein